MNLPGRVSAGMWCEQGETTNDLKKKKKDIHHPSAKQTLTDTEKYLDHIIQVNLR